MHTCINDFFLLLVCFQFDSITFESKNEKVVGKAAAPKSIQLGMSYLSIEIQLTDSQRYLVMKVLNIILENVILCS